MLKSLVLIFLIVILGLFIFGYKSYKQKMTTSTIANSDQLEDSLSIFPYKAELLNSDVERSMGDYKGKVMLIVNTASKCGLTPQYKELQALYEQLNGEDFALFGFPSNDFMSQEPGSEEEIAEFCQMNYGVDFDMFEKVHVKGDDKHPIYQFLTEKEKNGVMDSEVNWNFQKYLLNKEGRLVAVFQPKVSVESAEVQEAISKLLSE